MINESKGKYLLKNTLLFTLGNLGTRFISLLLVPIYTGVLDTKEYGVIDLVSTICAILVPIISMNIGEAVMRFSLDKNAEQERIMKIGWIFISVCIILGVCICPFFYLFQSTKDYVWLICMYSISMGVNQVAVCNLRGKELLLAYSISSIINSVVAAILNIIFLCKLNIGIKGYFLAFIIANATSCIYSLIIGKAFKSILEKTNYILLRNMVRYSVLLIPTSLMWWITNSSDRIMVSYFVNTAANGIYAISYKVPTLISSLTSIFNQAWAYSAIRENGSSDENEYTNNMYNNMFSTMMILGAGFLMIMKPFLSIYVSENYYSAWKYTPFLLVGSVFLTMGTFLSTSYTVHKDSKGFLISGTIGAIVNIILNFILIPKIEVYGAAIATCISYIVVFVFRLFDTKKYINISSFNFIHICGTINLVIMCITMFIGVWFGQLLLIAEFVLMIIIYRSIIIEYFKILKNILNKIKRT